MPVIRYATSIVRFFGCFTFILLLCTNAEAQAGGTDAPSLKGLRGVYVLVNDIRQDAQQDGLTPPAVKTRSELRLRQSGIRVLETSEWIKTAGTPCVIVNVGTIKYSGTYAFTLEVVLIQQAFLARNKNIKVVDCATWSESTIGVSSPSNLSNIVIRAVDEYVDKFCNAYLAMNPKVSQKTSLPAIRVAGKERKVRGIPARP